MAAGESMSVNVSELSQVVSGIEQIELAAGDTIVISTQERLSAGTALMIEREFGQNIPGVNVIVLPPMVHIEAVLKAPPTE